METLLAASSARSEFVLEEKPSLKVTQPKAHLWEFLQILHLIYETEQNRNFPNFNHAQKSLYGIKNVCGEMKAII